MDTMDTLPSELLFQIASYLPLKDLNSLLRVSKIVHWKVENHRSQLVKTTVAISIFRNCNCRKYIDFKVGKGVRYSRKYCYWMVQLGSKTDEKMKRTKSSVKDSNEVLVGKFYNNVIDTTSFLDATEGLSLHLHFLLPRVYVKNFRLDLLQYSDIVAITKAVNDTHTKFGTVELYNTSHFKQCHQELLVACKPQNLLIDGQCSLPDHFYQLPIIQKLNSLTDYTKGVNNIDILLLAATDLNINRLSNIDFSMILAYLKQWMESKREIKRLKTKVKLGKAKDELASLIDILNSKLVLFSRKDSAPGFSMTLQRRRDKATLTISRKGIRFEVYEGPQ